MSYGFSRRGALQYQQVGAHGARYADPHQQVKMLMDGVLDRLAQAKGAIASGDQQLKGKLLGRAVAIVDGLQGSLDGKAGGELAGNLGRLYGYMQRRLLHANLKSDVAAIDEVADLMRELRSGWDEIPVSARSIPPATGGDNLA